MPRISNRIFFTISRVVVSITLTVPPTSDETQTYFPSFENSAIRGIQSEAIQPVGVRLTSDGKRAFIALGPSNRIAVVDAQTFEVTKYLLVGQRVWQLGFDASEKLLFTTNGASNDISVIDTEALKVIKSIAVGKFPWGIAVKG